MALKKRSAEEELERLRGLLMEEEFFFAKGIKLIAGTDEAGRGPLAGPVVAASVILPRGKEAIFQGLDDSKKLSPSKRDKLYALIMHEATAAAVAVIERDMIDKINIYQASLLAMKQSIGKLSLSPQVILVDGFSLPSISIPQRAIPKGDAKSLSIAAASVVAKVTRDKLMEELHNIYPGYNFKKNKGYPTAEHKNKLLQIGPCPAHRKSFIKKIMGGPYLDTGKKETGRFR